MVEPSIAYGERLVKDDLPAKVDGGVWNSTTLMISMPAQLHYKIMPAVGLEEQGNRINEWIGSKDPGTQTDLVDSQEEQGNRINEWIGSKDPGTQTDLVDSEDKQVQELIYRFRTLSFIPYHKKLADRLLALFYYEKEEDPDSLCITAGSLRDFYDFLHLHDNLKYPSITLSPDNNILASWRSEQNRVFSVHFLSNKNVRFVIFKPMKKYPDRKFRLSGAATTDTLMDEIHKGMLDWITL